MDKGEEPASPRLREAEELLTRARLLLAEARESEDITEQGKGTLTAIIHSLRTDTDLIVGVEIRGDESPESDFMT
jgi:hypothetical protein